MYLSVDWSRNYSFHYTFFPVILIPQVLFWLRDWFYVCAVFPPGGGFLGVQQAAHSETNHSGPDWMLQCCMTAVSFWCVRVCGCLCNLLADRCPKYKLTATSKTFTRTRTAVEPVLNCGEVSVVRLVVRVTKLDGIDDLVHQWKQVCCHGDVERKSHRVQQILSDVPNPRLLFFFFFFFFFLFPSQGCKEIKKTKLTSLGFHPESYLLVSRHFRCCHQNLDLIKDVCHVSQCLCDQ